MLSKKFLFLLISLLFGLNMQAQQLAIKTNAVWDAVMVPNIGMDAVVGNRTTLGVSLYGSTKILGTNIKVAAVQPEYKYFFSGRAMHQHYLGFGALGLYYNKTENGRINSVYAAGGGLIFGYVMHLGNRWNIDFHAGCGAMYYRKAKFENHDNQTFSERQKGIFTAPTSVGVSFSYVLK